MIDPMMISMIYPIYPLVMTNIAMDNHYAIKFGKASVSIRAMASMAMLVITRG